MKSTRKKLWKHLKRHPLSAAYDDLTGKAWSDFLESFDEFDTGKPIFLSEGMVIEGWQRQRACVEKDIEPVYVDLAKDADLDKFVDRSNNQRRHESAESVSRRIAARRARVAEMVKAKASIASIAKQEEVSRPTIDDDIRAIQDATGCILKDENGAKVTGTDGKSYPAKKPTILCLRCSRVGETKDCSACAELRQATKVKPTKSGKPKFNEKKFDKAFGALTRVVDERGSAMGKGPHHKKCQDILGQFINEYKLWKKETA